MVEQLQTKESLDERSLSAAFSALADPTRRAIVHRLASGEATISELSEPFTMSFQAVSKHVRVLEHAGLVTRTKHAQERPCRLHPDAMARVTAWLGDYRHLWQASFDRLDEHLTTGKGSPT